MKRYGAASTAAFATSGPRRPSSHTRRFFQPPDESQHAPCTACQAKSVLDMPFRGRSPTRLRHRESAHELNPRRGEATATAPPHNDRSHRCHHTSYTSTQGPGCHIGKMAARPSRPLPSWHDAAARERQLSSFSWLRERRSQWHTKCSDR